MLKLSFKTNPSRKSLLHRILFQNGQFLPKKCLKTSQNSIGRFSTFWVRPKICIYIDFNSKEGVFFVKKCVFSMRNTNFLQVCGLITQKLDKKNISNTVWGNTLLVFTALRLLENLYFYFFEQISSNFHESNQFLLKKL